jgi:hypothetical protein
MSWMAAAALGAAGINYFGQKSANQTNARIASDASQMSQANAREQMAFQERMSNTAYQRGFADMKAAGINPILAGKTPASSPGGAMGQVFTYQHQNVARAAIDGYQIASQAQASQASAKQSTAQAALSKKQIKKVEAETKLIQQNKEFQEVLHSERWPRLFATMSAENVVASALAVVEGVSIEKVLAGQNHQLRAHERENLERFLYRVQGFKGTIAREVSGVGQKVDAAARAVAEKTRFIVDIIKELAK